MKKPVINIADVEFRSGPAAFTATGSLAARFGVRVKAIGERIGARHLGYSIAEVPPGKSAFPRHNHRVNEEMFLILEGSGELRMGGQTYLLRAGDVVACPPGGRETAHRIVNSGPAPLRYLAVSTRFTPDIVEYPDSDKFAVSAEFPPGADGQAQDFLFIGRVGGAVDYWDGE